ncbi:MAG: response regulator [Bacteroidales bacterium]|nr:response regulator [Bacteroidales bacterium]
MGLPKILYVDDEVINLELLQLTFMNEFTIVTAESAREGLKLLALNPDINVIISDLKMPVMNGLDFIKEVKRNNQEKVCMLLTGFMESEIMLEGFNKELIFRYLMKPWNKDELEKTIQEALLR